ncbi:MAG: sugar ABC transporter substrate-binding protein [Phycisphaerae bacterium]
MRQSRIIGMIVLALCVPLLNGACDSERSSDRPRYRRIVRIAVVGEARDEPTWPMLQSMAAGYQRRDPMVSVRVIAPDTPSPRAQQKLLEGLLDADFHVVCIIPTDPLAIRPAIKGLVKGGRPVVTIGRDVPASHRSVYCGPLEVSMGKTAAAACRLALAGRPRTLMVLHAGEDHEVYRARRLALIHELPFLGDIRVLKEVDCAGNPGNASRLTRIQSKQYPRVGGWVFLEDWALREIPPADRLLPLGCGLVLCNGSPRYFDRVRNGEIQALVVFDYYEAVEKALEAATRLAEGDQTGFLPICSVEPEIVTGKELKQFERRWRAWQEGKSSQELNPG